MRSPGWCMPGRRTASCGHQYEAIRVVLMSFMSVSLLSSLGIRRGAPADHLKTAQRKNSWRGRYSL